MRIRLVASSPLTVVTMIQAEIANLFASKKPLNQVSPASSLPQHHPANGMDRRRRASDTQSAGVSDLASAVIFAPNPGAPYSHQAAPAARTSPRPRDSRWMNLFTEEADDYNLSSIHDTSYHGSQAAGEPSYSTQPPPAPAPELYDFRHLDRDPAFHPNTQSFAPDSGTIFSESPRSTIGRANAYGVYANDTGTPVL
ncbi:hypothetical protein FRC07_012704 [Ceratobasidium sp. 392]|nr:hypothetical protein FRC07_012704 [Ceratobasidium sp. 392]